MAYPIHCCCYLYVGLSFLFLVACLMAFHPGHFNFPTVTMHVVLMWPCSHHLDGWRKMSKNKVFISCDMLYLSLSENKKNGKLDYELRVGQCCSLKKLRKK